MTPPQGESSREHQRLRALAELDVLDTGSEAAFDNVVALASQICGTPISLISLIDERRQWFKARTGLAATEAPREHAFCDHVIRGPDLLEVVDARLDQRFRDNPLVTGDPRIVYYAGVPLVTPGGDAIGALCVIDRRPRALSNEQRAALVRLGEQVTSLLEARKTAAEIQAERLRLRRIFDLSPAAIALLREPDFIFEEVNEPFRALINAENHLSRPWREVYGAAVDEEIFAALTQVYATGRGVELAARRLTADHRVFDVSVNRIEGPCDRRHRVLIRVTDVTEARGTTRALAESRRRLEETLQALPVAVSFLEGPEHRYSFTNDVHASFYGGRRDFVGRTLAEAVPEIGAGAVPALLARVYRTGEAHFDDELPVTLRQLDGSHRHLILQVSIQALREVSGQIVGVVVTSIDVTERVRTREGLRETERLLSAATAVAKVGFYEWMIPDDVVTFSEQMQRSWGIPGGVSLERVMEQIWPDDRDEVRTRIEAAIASGEPFFAQYRIKNPDGPGQRWIEAQGEVSYDAGGRPLTFLGTSIDITSRKTVESDAQTVANSIPQLAWMTDATGYILWYNQRWYEYTGTTFEQMRGWGWQAVQHPDHVERVKEKFIRHLRSTEPWEDTFPLRAQDGSYRWFLSRAVPLKDDAGNVVRWFGSNTDITDQRESERQVARLAAVVENSGDFVCMLDCQLRPIFINPGARRLTSFDGTRISSLLEFFPPGERDVIARTVLPVLRLTGTWEGESALRTEAGAVPVWLNLFVVRDPRLDAPLAYAMVARDVSERKAFERSLEEAKDAAERANAAKSVFLANMSHEIRSPLGAIMGFADLIRNPELPRDELAEHVAVINRNSHHLLRIVDDILDLSKVEAGKMMIEHIEFSFTDLLADFTSLIAFRARDKGISFDLLLATPIPESVVSDPTRLRQILVNVVGNAVKFTDRGGVRLTVGFDDGTLTFTVDDTGPGISPEQAERLFRAFQQADVSTTRKYGGTGLGLVLTRRLAEALGGGFRLDRSAPGEGSTFVVTITVDRCRNLKMVSQVNMSYHADVPRAAPAAAPLTGLNVLVIEDSPDNQVLFELILERLGASVTIARDGVEGVAVARAGAFDVVLCDVQMPRMDGYEATRDLRAKGYARPIVALTAHAMKEERQRALAAGFSAFLSKPLQKDLLIETLLRVTGRA